MINVALVFISQPVQCLLLFPMLPIVCVCVFFSFCLSFVVLSNAEEERHMFKIRNKKSNFQLHLKGLTKTVQMCSLV